MTTVLAFDGSAERTGVDGVATAFATTLNLGIDRRTMPLDVDAGTARSALEEPGVRLAVLPYFPENPEPYVTELIRSSRKPLVLVPREIQSAARRVSRILVPLDGTAESAETVSELVRMFAESGSDIVVLRVFDASTVPRFWDQPVHARKSWDREFLARYCDYPNARIELRAGVPGEHIVEVSKTEHADLIALGWAQDLSPGRAQTVRATLLRSTIPVLLLPIVASSEQGLDPRPLASGMGRAR